MLADNLRGGSYSGGGGGGGLGGQFMNFPLTLAGTAPTMPEQGEREGHIWIVIPDSKRQFVTNIVIDDADRVGHSSGTLVIRVSGFDENKVYISQQMRVGETNYPIVYNKAGRDPELVWPITMFAETGAANQIYLRRPADKAKLVTNDDYELYPLYCFDGEKWLVPTEWHYAYYSNLRVSGGVDEKWKCFKINDDTFLKQSELPEYDLNPIIQQIIRTDTQEPNPDIEIGGDGLMLFNVGRTDVSRMYAAYVNKRELQYLGKVDLSSIPSNVTEKQVVACQKFADADYQNRCFTYQETSGTQFSLVKICFDPRNKTTSAKYFRIPYANIVNAPNCGTNFSGTVGWIRSQSVWVGENTGFVVLGNAKKVTEANHGNSGLTLFLCKFVLDNVSNTMTVTNLYGFYDSVTGINHGHTCLITAISETVLSIRHHAYRYGSPSDNSSQYNTYNCQFVSFDNDKMNVLLSEYGSYSYHYSSGYSGVVVSPKPAVYNYYIYFDFTDSNHFVLIKYKYIFVNSSTPPTTIFDFIEYRYSPNTGICTKIKEVVNSSSADLNQISSDVKFYCQTDPRRLRGNRNDLYVREGILIDEVNKTKLTKLTSVAGSNIASYNSLLQTAMLPE